MKRTVFIVSIVIFAALALCFSFLFLKRIGLPYNREGNYFDQNDLVTYKVQSVEVYGLLSLMSLVITGILFWIYFLMKRLERLNR